MTDYRRAAQTTKDAMINGTTRGIENLMAFLAQPENSFNTARNGLYRGIDQMTGLQGQATNTLANQQVDSDKAFARGQELFRKPGRQAQYAMQQMGAPQTLLDLLNPGQPAYEALNSGQMAIDDMIAQLQAAGNSEKAQALLQLKQEMAAKAAEIYHGTAQQVQQGYDAAREKAAGLIQQLMGN